MNKQEAIEKLNQGHKVNHIYFIDDDFIYKNDINQICDAFGNYYNEKEYWDKRKDETWNIGWKVVENDNILTDDKGFWMTHLWQEETGLSVNLWIQPKPINYNNIPYIQCQNNYDFKITTNQLVSISIEENPKFLSGYKGILNQSDFNDIFEYVKLNINKLLKFWNSEGELCITDLSLKSIQASVILEMSNVAQTKTGLPMMIWIEPGNGRKNTHYVPRIKIQTDYSVKHSQTNTISISIEKEPKILTDNKDYGKLKDKDIQQALDFVKKNHRILLKFWNNKVKLQDVILFFAKTNSQNNI